MKVTQKKIDDKTVKLEATATAEEVANALHAAQLAFAQSMGLRPQKDKTIQQVAEEQMGIKNLDSIIEQQAMSALIPLALDKKNIIPAFLPELKAKTPFKRGQEFRFEMDITPKPEYELKSYDDFAFTAPKFTFDESLVDARLDEMADRYKTYEKAEDVPADRTIEPMDNIKIALEAYEGDKRLDGLSTDGRTYSVGQGYMPDGFDRAIIGMKVGETKEFTFEGPGFDDDFNEYTQKVDAKVTVLELQQEVKPVIDDEWLKKNMPMAGGLDALRSNIRRDMERAAKMQYDAFIRQLAASEAAKRFEGKIPDEVYEMARSNMMTNIRMQLQQEGKTWETFVEENGGDQQFGMMMMLQIREMLVQGFALDAIFKHMNLTLTDEDLDEAAMTINPQVNPKQLREQMVKSGQGFVLRESAERLKANNWLVENSKITYQDTPGVQPQE